LAITSTATEALADPAPRQREGSQARAFRDQDPAQTQRPWPARPRAVSRDAAVDPDGTGWNTIYRGGGEVQPPSPRQTDPSPSNPRPRLRDRLRR